MSYTVPMSNVQMSITSEEFITSETAKLSFEATYAITDPSVDAKSEILDAANRIVDGEWYVTGVYRDTSNAGIETVTYSLSIRVAEKLVSGIKSAIKAVNRSGLQFELTNTDYTPTQAQIEAGNKNLRKSIYVKANEELEILNEVAQNKSSDEIWVIGSVNFNTSGAGISKSNLLASASVMYENAGPRGPSGPQGPAGDEGDGVTQKLTLTAAVSFTRKIYSRL